MGGQLPVPPTPKTSTLAPSEIRARGRGQPSSQPFTNLHGGQSLGLPDSVPLDKPPAAALSPEKGLSGEPNATAPLG